MPCFLSASGWHTLSEEQKKSFTPKHEVESEDLKESAEEPAPEAPKTIAPAPKVEPPPTAVGETDDGKKKKKKHHKEKDSEHKSEKKDKKKRKKVHHVVDDNSVMHLFLARVESYTT